MYVACCGLFDVTIELHQGIVGKYAVGSTVQLLAVYCNYSEVQNQLEQVMIIMSIKMTSIYCIQNSSTILANHSVSIQKHLVYDKIELYAFKHQENNMTFVFFLL